MGGWAYLVGYCIACKRLIHFNPHRVPSLMVDGRREPLCRTCAERWNEIHKGQERAILSGAYEPFPEEEL